MVNSFEVDIWSEWYLGLVQQLLLGFVGLEWLSTKPSYIVSISIQFYSTEHVISNQYRILNGTVDEFLCFWWVEMEFSFFMGVFFFVRHWWTGTFVENSLCSKGKIWVWLQFNRVEFQNRNWISMVSATAVDANR